MRKSGYNLGGEQSGHVILMDYNTTGDGQLSAVQLTKIMKETGKSLSELAAEVTITCCIVVHQDDVTRLFTTKVVA